MNGVEHKEHIRSHIERTQGLIKTQSGSVGENKKSLTHSGADYSPVKRIQKPDRIATSNIVPITSPKASSIASLTQANIRAPKAKFNQQIEKSSLEFVKNIKIALNELSLTHAMRLRTEKELRGKEEKNLMAIRKLVEEYKKGLRSENSGEELERNFQKFAQDTALSLCELENKCETLREENSEMKKILVHQENEGRNAREIIEILARTTEFKSNKLDLDELNIETPIQEYSKTIRKMAESWGEALNPGQYSFALHKLADTINNIHLHSEEKNENLSNYYSKLKDKRTKLEKKINNTLKP
jgi:hypothetical protein